MDDAVELRDLGGRLRRRWWIPVLLAAGGVVLGMLVAERVAPVYRAQGTLLVGPVSGTVTHSTTLRASESLATFYADLARRQVVLGPVVDSLHLSTSWDDLRNEVSAVVPDQNPRLVTVTVADPGKASARQIAGAIVQRLVTLSPQAPAGSGMAFVNRQIADLQKDIELAETQIPQLDGAIAHETRPPRRAALVTERSQRQQLLDEWRNTYVDLMSVDPTSDAGGIRVIDEVRPLTALDRAGAVRQGALGGVIGLVLGMLVVWLFPRFGGRRSSASPVEQRGRRPTDAVVSTAARQSTVVPALARSPAHET